MADEELELDVTQPKGNKMTTILLIVLIVLVLIMGGVGAWLFLGSDSSGDKPSASDKKEEAEKVLGPITYLTLVPEFVVNFGPGSKVRYLQVDIQIATRDANILPIVNNYRPVIRNDILVLLSGLTFDELKVRNGKEALQKKILNTINKVVNSVGHGDKHAEANETAQDGEAEKNDDVAGPVENVYFTSFIMQ